MNGQLGLANGGNMMAGNGLSSPMNDSDMMLATDGPVIFDDHLMPNGQANFGSSQFDNDMLQTSDSSFYPGD